MQTDDMRKVGNFLCHPITVVLVVGRFDDIKARFAVPTGKRWKNLPIEVELASANNAMNAHALLINRAVPGLARRKYFDVMVPVAEHESGLLDIGGDSPEGCLRGIFIRDKSDFHVVTRGGSPAAFSMDFACENITSTRIFRMH